MSQSVAEKAAPILHPMHYAFIDGAHGLTQFRETTLARLQALVKERHGATLPTYEAWCNDREALLAVCKEKGYSDHSLQHLKTYSLVIQALYGAAPVAMNHEANRKRRERVAELGTPATQAFEAAHKAALAKGLPAYAAEALADAAAKRTKGKKQQASAGAPAGQTQQHPVSTAESVEQFVTRVGIFETVDALARILATQKETQIHAATLTALSNQLRLLLKPREAAAAPHVETPATPEQLQALAMAAEATRQRGNKRPRKAA